VQMVSTSTKESSSLEKTLPVTVRLQRRTVAGREFCS
jgi:hypothetical protein